MLNSFGLFLSLAQGMPVEAVGGSPFFCFLRWEKAMT
jgi:hypothetical protein